MNYKIGIIGLGYVGLPLAIAFGKKLCTIGYDIDSKRMDEVANNIDNTYEVDDNDFVKSKYLSFTSDIQDLKSCNFFIVTVPTPIDRFRKPDLSQLKNATKEISEILKINDIVIYESTVYPGATEEICVPILEKISGLKFNKDFFCGYSPERINPGDKQHRIENIKKLTSGSTKITANKVDKLYNLIIKAGTHKTSSIKIAEAAKVIENTQRDINIALVNELSLIFKELDIDTEAVLNAAQTKWNFHHFKPGLVGGHCIGVDPYYLTYKATSMNYNPEIILSGRRLNDSMGLKVASQILELMSKKNINKTNSKILIMGLSFKENCPDIRNTKVIDIINEFKNHKLSIDVYDPWVKKKEVLDTYGFELIEDLGINKYDVIVLAVGHDKFKKIPIKKLKKFAKKNHVIYDVKYIYKQNEVDGRL